MNLIEKENALLKLGSNKQRFRINQLTSEVLALRNKLDYLESEIQIKKYLERDEEVQHVAHKLYFPRSPRETLVPAENRPSATIPRTRRRLAFEDAPKPSILGSQSSESSSNSLSATNRLTDEIVADAKNKLKELEVESEMLNHNFQNLQTVLSRNMTFAERSFLASSSMTDSSPQERRHHRTRLTRSVSDLNSPNAMMSPGVRNKSYLSDYGESSPSSRTDHEISPRSPMEDRGRKTTAFSRIFHKYRQKKPIKAEDDFRPAKEAQQDERAPVRLTDEAKSVDANFKSRIKAVEESGTKKENNHLDTTTVSQDLVDIQQDSPLEDRNMADTNISAGNYKNLISGSVEENGSSQS